MKHIHTIHEFDPEKVNQHRQIRELLVDESDESSTNPISNVTRRVVNGALGTDFLEVTGIFFVEVRSLSADRGVGESDCG